MALVLRPEARHWVAAIKINGKLCRLPLTSLQDGVEVSIPIEGRRPSSLKCLEEGDRVFMNSYHTALSAHDRLVQELKSRNSERLLTERIVKAKTGKRQKVTKVSEIPSKWRQTPRKKKPGKEYLKQGSSILGRFVQ